jgi:hypothetical protein
MASLSSQHQHIQFSKIDTSDQVNTSDPVETCHQGDVEPSSFDAKLNNSNPRHLFPVYFDPLLSETDFLNDSYASLTSNEASIVRGDSCTSDASIKVGGREEGEGEREKERGEEEKGRGRMRRRGERRGRSLTMTTH